MVSPCSAVPSHREEETGLLCTNIDIRVEY